MPPPKRASAQGNPETRGGAGSRGTRQLGPKDRGLEAANGRLKGSGEREGIVPGCRHEQGKQCGIVRCSRLCPRAGPRPGGTKITRFLPVQVRELATADPDKPAPDLPWTIGTDPKRASANSMISADGQIVSPPAPDSWHDLNRHDGASSRTDLTGAPPPTLSRSSAAHNG